MNTPRVSREQAELLKKVGYSEEVHYRYDTFTGAVKEPVCASWYNWNKATYALSAPTLDEAARWLRDVKGWHVIILWAADDNWAAIVMKPISTTVGVFTTHDLALSAGIDLILKKLTDGTD